MYFSEKIPKRNIFVTDSIKTLGLNRGAVQNMYLNQPLPLLRLATHVSEAIVISLIFLH